MIVRAHPPSYHQVIHRQQREREGVREWDGGGEWVTDEWRMLWSPLCFFNWIWMDCHCVKNTVERRDCCPYVCTHIYRHTHPQTWQIPVFVGVFVCAYVYINVNTRICLRIFCYTACLQVTLLSCEAAASKQWEVTEERIPFSFVARLGWLCEAQSSPMTESLFLGRWARNRTHILHTPSM